MVNPVLIAKVAVAVLGHEKTRKGIGWILVGLFSPIILMTVLISSMLSGTAKHNNTALELAFYGGTHLGSAPEEFMDHIKEIQDSFSVVDTKIAEVDRMIETSKYLDSIRVKSIFYSLYFGDTQPSDVDVSKFVDCFVSYEERTRTIYYDDGTTSQESYIVANPIEDISRIYEKIEDAMGNIVTAEDKANATESYYRILYGGSMPTYGQGFDDFINDLEPLNVPFIGIEDIVSPIGENWKSVVTSEFGQRKDPFTGQIKKHGGIDLGVPKGTPISSVLDGKVVLVRYATTGYGYHVVLDHGGGFITIYAHCSKIMVHEGESVTAGQEIAQVGSTGKSTGNHLHFEIRMDGKKVNPRYYIP